MSNTTANTAAFIEAQQYSAFILENLHTVLLPTIFYRDVSDFGAGTTLNIKTVGTASIQEVEEDTPLIYNPIETGNITMQITDYIGNAWYVTDILRQDGSQIETLMAMYGMENTRAINTNFETRVYEVANLAQADSDDNLVNGHAHRRLASGGSEQMAENDLIDMRLAFDKANVPMAGRIAIVDPVVAATFSKLITMTSAVDHSRNPIFQKLLEDGFANEHSFALSLHGWDIWTSNLLPTIAAGAGVGTSTTVTNAGIANIFMSVLDDNTKPVMVAWRQQPKVEGERNKDRQRDEFVTTARWGVGVQRLDTLGVIVTDAVATA
tara:strand:- start:2246 stop:3214 length:969 start_codon:yes stop_codon:yes gene_type:complete